MVTIHFKEVGQGDSIIIDWQRNGKRCIGLIDCNNNNGINSTLNFLINEKITDIEFIVLSHFHEDHFSGLASIFRYCITNKIRVGYFYHTLGPFVIDIYNRIFTSKKLEKNIADFFSAYEDLDGIILDKLQINPQMDFNLTDKIILSFLAPFGLLYDKMARQLSRKVNKIVTTKADINKLATIILIHDGNDGILLTSDAIKKVFRELRRKISQRLLLSQAPHHGSWPNIDNRFWESLNKIDDCPCIFSVGYQLKDKLPNHETVEFFATNDYDVFSTNNVFGINSYFGLPPNPTAAQRKRGVFLNSFSNLRHPPNPIVHNKYQGDHSFTFF